MSRWMATDNGPMYVGGGGGGAKSSGGAGVGDLGATDLHDMLAFYEYRLAKKLQPMQETERYAFVFDLFGRRGLEVMQRIAPLLEASLEARSQSDDEDA